MGLVELGEDLGQHVHRHRLERTDRQVTRLCAPQAGQIGLGDLHAIQDRVGMAEQQ